MEAESPKKITSKISFRKNIVRQKMHDILDPPYKSLEKRQKFGFVT